MLALGKGEESSFHEGGHKKFFKWLVAPVCLLPNRENLRLSLRFWGGDKDGSPGGRSGWDPANPSGGVRASARHLQELLPLSLLYLHPAGSLQPLFDRENPEAVPITSGKGGYCPPIRPRPRGQSVRERASRSRWWRPLLSLHGSLHPSRPPGDTTTAFPIGEPDSSKIPSLSRGPRVAPPQLPGPQHGLGGRQVRDPSEWHTRVGRHTKAGEGTEGMSQDTRS